MKHPVFALIWQSWRMARRWYLLVLLISTYLGWLLLHLKAPTFLDSRVYQLVLAGPALVIVYTIACLSTLMAISVGNKNGFPFSFEFRLPVSTLMLVTVPMLFMGVLCASLYFIPLGLYRLLLDIPFPLLPGAALLISIVAVLLCSSWSTTNNSSRFLAVTCAIVAEILMFSWLKPLHINFRKSSAELSFGADIISLNGFQYVILMFVTVLVLGMTAFIVARQRNGETLRHGGRGQQRTKLAEAGTGTGKSLSVFAMAEALSGQLFIACPTTRAWQAETWLECKRFTFPILLFSAAVAGLIPLLLMFGAATHWPAVRDITACSPLIIYVTGIGLSLFNRRKAHNGYMNVFEASRAMSTLQLASVQIFTLAIATAIGIALVKASLYLSEPLAGELRASYIKLGSLLAPLPDASLLMQANNLVMENVIYVGIIAMFACLHSCSVLWGRKSMILVLLLVAYALTLALRIRNDPTLVQTIINHMWGISIFISVLTVAVLISICWLQLISARGMMMLLLLWLVFFACSYFNLEQRGYHFRGMAPELLALNVNLLLLPLTFAALTLWCYDRLRHA